MIQSYFIRFAHISAFKELTFCDASKNDFHVETPQSSNNCPPRFVLHIDKHPHSLGRGVDIFHTQVFVSRVLIG